MKYIFLSCLILSSAATAFAQNKKNVSPEIGVVQNMENDSILHAIGFRYLVESVGKLLSPRNVSEEQFAALLPKIKKLHIPLYACNLFIPGDLKVVGPVVNEKAVLDYVDVVLQRGHQAGLTLIIWGSGGSRGVPEGFDRTKAKEQFIAMGKKIAALAKKHNITLALENLNSTECNFINKVEEAYEVVNAINHENLRMCVDIYHMLKEGENPLVIEKAKKYLIYCEIAEKENRTPPGVHGDDFRPYLTSLKKIGYSGKIVIECRWDDVASQGAPAYQYLKKQIDEVFASNMKD